MFSNLKFISLSLPLYITVFWSSQFRFVASIPLNSTGTFKYFAYGSNLLEQRIHANNPTARRVAIGKLKDYRLDFNYWSQRWQGNAATIVPQNQDHVWGAIWEISITNMPDLDKQEGVGEGIYKVLSVQVELPDGQFLDCRSYQLNDVPDYVSPLPPSRYPSKIYLDTIIRGAIESGLPADYVNRLKTIPHNGYDKPVDMKTPK